MTTEFQKEQDERIATMRQDADLRQQQQASTLHQHAQAQADELSQGRFRATGAPVVTGASPVPQYPAGPDWTIDPVPAERPLGFSIENHEPTGTAVEIQASIDKLHADTKPEGDDEPEAA